MLIIIYKVVVNVNWPKYEVITIQLQIFGVVRVLIVSPEKGPEMSIKKIMLTFGLLVLKEATDGMNHCWSSTSQLSPSIQVPTQQEKSYRVNIG